MPPLRNVRLSAVLLAAVILTGCASARMSDTATDRAFREGRYDEAADRLSKGLAKEGEEGKDGLLYLLDLGLVLHTSGKYDESNRIFLKADKLAEIKDYTSLSTEAGTLLTSDNIRQYKGEDFENVLINTYLAMNYALLGDYDNALVEARRVNRKLYMMVTEGKRKYKQNGFARYLSGLLYEAQGNPNDAYLDYKFARDLEPDFPGLGLDLWRTAWMSGLRDEMARWDKEYQLGKEDHERAKLSSPKSGKGEIIVLYENGISPVKHPNPRFREIPKFYPRPNPVMQARIEVNGQEVARTAELHNIEKTAIQNLDEKYAGLIARKVAGVVAKEVVGDQIARRTHSPLLGAAAKIFFYVSDQADVRSWNLLPHDLQIARITVDPGTYEVKAIPVGAIAAGMLPPKSVQVQAGKKVFVNFRYLP